MDQVAAKQDLVLARVENVAHVAWSVPRHRNCHHMIVQPASASNRDKQLPKARQVWLVDKTCDGIVSDHDPAQICKRFSTIARQKPV